MTRADQIFERFEKFHRENPEVWEKFKAFTRQLMAAQHQHYSSDAVLHRIRWESAIQTSGSNFKINDHYSALYARLWQVAFPEHEHFFKLRHRKSELQPERPDALDEATGAEVGIDLILSEKLKALL